MRCLARDGYSRTSMRDVAREAGVTTGAIYAHFSGKDALVAALGERFRDLRAQALQPNSGSGKYQTLSSALDAHTAYLDGEEADGALRSDIVMLAEALDLPFLRELLINADLEQFAAYEGLLKETPHLQPEQDIATLARVIVGAVFGFLILRAFHPSINRRQYFSTLTSLVEGVPVPRR